MRSLRIALAALVLGTGVIALTPAAEAKKEAAPVSAAASFEGVPAILPTQIPAFDDTVFTEAAKIQTNVKGIYDGVNGARTNFNTALGIATDAPIATALADLKAKGASMMKLTMDGTTPKISAADAAPENIVKAVAGINGLITSGAGAVKSTTELVPQVQTLVKNAATFPMKLPTLLSGLSPEIAKAAPKILGDNMKGLAALPKQISAIASEVASLFKDIQGMFSS